MGNAVIVVGVGSDGHVKEVFDLNRNKMSIVDETREDKKPMIGASLTNGDKAEPCRYVPDKNGDWQAEPVNLDFELPKPDPDAPVVLLAAIDENGTIVRAIRLSDLMVMTDLIGERLGSHTNPCCWMDLGAGPKCYQCA